MNYTVVSSSEWMYPDVFEYATAGKTMACHAARGGYLAAQVQLTGLAGGHLSISCEMEGAAAAFEMEFYEMVPVFVEGSAPEAADPKPLYPNRAGAFYVYDCLKPLGGSCEAMDGAAGLYFSAKVPRDCAPGMYTGKLKLHVGGAMLEIPVEFRVHKAILPPETLKFTNWYNPYIMAKYHNTEMGGEEYKRLDLLYHRMMRRSHQNLLRVDGGIEVKETGENQYEFDFTGFEAYVKAALQLGFTHFQMPAIGGRKSWSESTIYVYGGKLPCLSYEGYAYLSQYLGALGEVLRQGGWMDMFYLSIADEPNEPNAVEYRALCGVARHLLPGVKLFDAMSHGPFYGSLDVYVPLNSEYEQHRDEFERFRGGGDELWHYVCCHPRKEGYINRFMDYPLLATRYLFWGNYKYGLTGYLHWALNQYQPGQDPFTQNCPEHHNADSVCFLPPGDTHVVYPGEGEPWMSMRLEAQRESAEEYEMLKALAEKDRAAADGICAKCFRGFNDVENDPAAFDRARVELLEALGRVQV